MRLSFDNLHCDADSRSHHCPLMQEAALGNGDGSQESELMQTFIDGFEAELHAQGTDRYAGIQVYFVHLGSSAWHCCIVGHTLMRQS